MGVKRNIVLDESSGSKITKLSAHLKADSFVYECFDAYENIVKQVAYSGLDVSQSIQTILTDLTQDLPGDRTLTVYGKPFLHSVNRNDRIVNNILAFYKLPLNQSKLLGYDAYTIYGHDWLDSLIKVFGQEHVQHISNTMVYDYFPNVRQSVIAYIDDATLHVAYLLPDQFMFYNEFETDAKEDYLYWLTLVYKALELNKMDHRLILSGRIDTEGEIFKLLRGYFPSINVEDNQTQRSIFPKLNVL